MEQQFVEMKALELALLDNRDALAALLASLTDRELDELETATQMLSDFCFHELQARDT